MNQILAKNYCQILLRYGVNLQPGQKVRLSAPVAAAEFAELLCAEAYRYGAGDVQMNWHSPFCQAQRLQFAEPQVLREVADWEIAKCRNWLDENYAVITLVSCDEPYFTAVSSDSIAASQQARREALQFFSRAVMNSELQWLVASVATPAWAALLYPELESSAALAKLWEDIFHVSRVAAEQPLEHWQTHLDNLHRRRRSLNDLRIDSLHYRSANGTDFVIGLPPTHIWQGGNEKSGRVVPFAANIPTEEVFTAPDFRRMDGVVYSTRPLIADNQHIEGIRLEFRAGKVVRASAEQGNDALQHLLEADEGARFLGEVALVPKDSPIAEIPYSFMETLIDENASCHLALGAAYPTCITDGKTFNDDELRAAGLNRSQIHVDFMIGAPDLEITATTVDGRKIPVFRDGKWAEEFSAD